MKIIPKRNNRNGLLHPPIAVVCFRFGFCSRDIQKGITLLHETVGEGVVTCLMYVACHDRMFQTRFLAGHVSPTCKIALLSDYMFANRHFISFKDLENDMDYLTLCCRVSCTARSCYVVSARVVIKFYFSGPDAL